MKFSLNYLYTNTRLGKFIGNIYFNIYNIYWTKIVSDKKVINKMYKKSFGKNVEFENPKTLNEKINWLKLNDRTSLHTLCADKFEVREYIKEKIGENYLIPLISSTENVDDLNFDQLPDIPIVIKTNHDSGGVFIVKDKKGVNFKEIKNNLKSRLKKNYYYNTSKEWQYKNIVPRIIIERMLTDKNGNIPPDYKFHCFNGKVRMVQVDVNRGTDKHFRNWYDRDWNREPYKWSSKKGKNKYTDPSEKEITAPRNLTKMIELSEKLAKPFCYVRVDWYDVDGRIYFGELTFHHDSGYAPIVPYEWDLKLGQELVLNPTKIEI